MTSIIFRGLENDNFNLFKFYVARANRIIPALAVLCLVLLVFGWFYLIPIDYRALSKHAASSMGFLSNVIYLRESGYFDASSHEKWLLHTWSLSVEWQFYILYPIVLIALKKFLSLNTLKKVIFIGTILGFVFSVIATAKWPTESYYLLATRAWEMMMGGVAFLYPWHISRRKKKLTETIGLVLILVSYAFMSSDVLWPGHLALLPVLGAYLMIASNQQLSVITNNKIFQCLGKWSYSIYLWHWPIVVFAYVYDAPDYFVFLGIALSVLLGFISYTLVEKLSIISGEIRVKNVRKVVFSTVSIVPIFSVLIYLNNGVIERGSLASIGYTEEVNYQLAGPIWNYTNNNICLSEHKFEHSSSLKWWFCMQNKEGEPTILLLGNSFANQLYPGFIHNDALKEHTVLSIGTCGFASKPSDDVESPCYGELKKLQKDFIFNEIISFYSSLKLIVIDGLPLDFDSEYKNRFEEQVKEIRSVLPDVNIVVFNQHLRPGFNPSKCYRYDVFQAKNCDISISKRTENEVAFNSFKKDVLSYDERVMFFDQNDVFCNEEKCSFIRNGLPLHRDRGHTSEFASEVLHDYFTPWLRLNIPDLLN
jgi:peptidoglycan/LPS O-acetylase OafA/YrhL